MTTTDGRWDTSTRLRTITAATVALAVLVSLGVLLHQYGPGRMWLGYATGVALAGAGFVVAGWRVSRRPDRATPVERALVHAGDERDDDVLTRALAVVGLLSMPMAAIASIVIAVGAPGLATTGALVWSLLVLLVLAYVVVNRRR